MSYEPIRIRIDGMPQLLRRLREGDKVVVRELTNAMDASVKVVEANVKPLTPVGVSGRLRNSIASKVEVQPGSVVGKVGSTLTGEQYPAVMEFGRRPGAAMPPPSALLRWVELRMGVRGAAAMHTAVRLARSIARKGIKGKRFIKQGAEKSMAFITQRFGEALRRMGVELSRG